MKRSETWDDGPVQSGPEGEAPPTARELLDKLACTHAGVWPVREGACPKCFLAMTARVEKVLALHTSDHGYCAECGGEWVSSNVWPCKTRRILNGESE